MGHCEDLRNIFPYLDITIIQEIINLVRSEICDNDRVRQLERMVTLLMDYPKKDIHYLHLKEMFPFVDCVVIDDIIELVKSEISDESEVQQLERMVTLLSGASNKNNQVENINQENHGVNHIDIDSISVDGEKESECSDVHFHCNFHIDEHPDSFVNTENDDSDDEDSDGEAECIERQLLKAQLLQTFPKISRKYIENILTDNELTFDDAVLRLQSNAYPLISTSADDILKTLQMISPKLSKDQLQIFINNGLIVSEITEKFLNGDCNEKDFMLTNPHVTEVYKKFMEMLPAYNHDFLLEEAIKLETGGDFTCALQILMDMKNYPTTNEYYETLTDRRKCLKHLFDFKIDAFLNAFPNLIQEFQETRVHSLITHSSNIEIEKDRCFAGVMLSNVYKHMKQRKVIKSFKRNNYDIIATCRDLEVLKLPVQIEKNWLFPENSYTNSLMFQELVYGLYQHIINNYKRIQGKSQKCAYQNAKDNNVFQTCLLCHAKGLLFASGDCYQCTKGCVVCKTCMQQRCGVTKDGMKCFLECNGHFNDISIELMDNTEYQKLMRQKQIATVVNSKEFSTNPNNEDKPFKCSACTKETCRGCSLTLSNSLLCEEIEIDETRELTTDHENQMTNAISRTCTACGESLVKMDMSNIGFCICGISVCFECGVSGIDDRHFTTSSIHG